MLTRSQAIRGAQNFILIFLSIGIVALYSSWRRPIWTDEATHFVWGANPISLDTLLKIIDDTHVLQHGQTGFYLLLNNVSLNLLGASEFVLRGPSIVAGVLLCLLSAYFMRFQQFGLRWQGLAMLSVGSLSYVMYFAGEARPYMILATSTVGILTYYSGKVSYSDSTSDSVALGTVGFSSVAIGVLNHPYFGLYWVSICALAFTWWHREKRSKFSVKALWHFSNPRLVLVGGVAYLSLGLATWMRPNPRGDVDPFEFQARENLPRIFVDAHFNFVWPYEIFAYAFVTTVVTIFILLMISKTRNLLITPLWMPISLIGLAGFITLGLSIASYLSDYWILSRQWIASMALIPIAYVWFFAILSRQFAKGNRRAISVFIFGLATVPVALAFGERVGTQLDRLREYSAQFSEIEVPSGVLTDAKKQELWTELGWGATNVNVKVGGPVWEVFKQ